jgi:hypothetical protein
MRGDDDGGARDAGVGVGSGDGGGRAGDDHGGGVG